MPDVKRPIVAFAHHPWVEPEWMNRQQILSRLGKRGWPVVYSFGALDFWQRKGERWVSSPLFNKIIRHDGIIDVRPGRFGARWKTHKTIDDFALRRHARFLRAQVARPHEKIIVLLFDPQFVPYIRHLEPCDVAYHAYDDFSRQPGWSDEKAALQRWLLKQAKLITASSESIAQTLQSPRTRVLENGADVEAFKFSRDLPPPTDLASIPHPRIGYVGTLNRKVDFPMIAHVARLRPEWHWVLVGRSEHTELENDSELASAYRVCLESNNVHFLGQKNRTYIPAYVGNMDINTMCYRHGGEGWWNAGSPLKLHEYLSSGQPVVSAPLAAVMPFKEYIQIAYSKNEWIETIEKLIEEHDSLAKARTAIAQENSWDKRVDTLEKWLQEITL